MSIKKENIYQNNSNKFINLSYIILGVLDNVHLK